MCLSTLSSARLNLGIQAGLGLYQYETARNAGREVRNLAEEEATKLEAAARRFGRERREVTHEMHLQKKSDIAASRTAAGKAGIRVGGGTHAKVLQVIQNTHNRNIRRYGQQTADAMQRLYDKAYMVRREGAIRESAGKRRATAQLLGTGANIFFQGNEYGWGNLLGI